MKLPSIQKVFRESTRTFMRFPFVMVAAGTATVAALILVDYEGPPGSSVLFNILFASILGFPLMLALALVAERRGWGKSLAFSAQAIGVLLLVAYALSVPSNILCAPLLHLNRLLLLVLASSLLVAVAPFAASGQLNGFWQYNKTLLQRIILAALFSVILFAGLAIALAAVDQLFGVDVTGKRYAELGLFLLGIFATWFLLAGVPEDLDGLETLTEYPGVLKLSGQYILIPLLFVYLVILYAYLAKIAIQWSWPQGWVSGLVFGFAATGITAYLLLFPIREKTENRWIKGAARWFWIVMIPPIVVLHLAIWRRVSEYGITEMRYFGFALGAWLAAMVAYFLASRTKNIKVIPASICVLALLTSFGPWGAFRVSEKSQVDRLEQLLVQNHLLADGKVQTVQGQVSAADAGQISSIVRYLRDVHGYERIQPWFSESLKRDSTGMGLIDQEPDIVVKALGVEYVKEPIFTGGNFREIRADKDRTVNSEGYDHLLAAQRLSLGMPDFTDPNDGIAYGMDSALDVLTMREVDGRTIVDSVQVSLRPLVNSLLEEYGSVAGGGIPPEKMSASAATETMKLKVVLRRIEFRRDKGQIKPTAYDAFILYSWNRR
jgi:hypothetical protein